MDFDDCFVSLDLEAQQQSLDRLTKKAIEETEEVTTVAKRKGFKMYLHGENFLKASSV